MHTKYNSPALWLCCMDIKIYGLAEMNSTWYFGKISCKIKNSSLNMKSQYGNLKSVEVKSQFLLKIDKKVDVNVKTQRS